jgi:protein TonB
MQQPNHVITRPGVRWTNERIVGVGFVALLHVVAIWAILNGLAQKIVTSVIPPDLVMTFPHVDQPPPPPAPPLPHVDAKDLSHNTVVVPLPPIDVHTDTQTQVTGSTDTTPPQPPVADTFASGVANTHTVPSYPPLARRLGEQGSVRLSLTISATGDVTGASVVQSSGFADLDQTAVDWVLGHWKYKPATHGGIAVPSQSLAIVVFNLQNAR